MKATLPWDKLAFIGNRIYFSLTVQSQKWKIKKSNLRDIWTM